MMDDEQLDARVAAALEAMRRADPETADLAEHAWQWVYGPLGPEAARRHHLQTFLWYGLPRKWLTDVEEHLAAAEALGDLCERLELTAHAATCRSAETREILLAYDRDGHEGFAAFQRALDRSGLDPPDVPELRWGGMMSIDEARAREHVADVLELAVDQGRLRPGARGWRGEQVRIAQAALHDLAPEQPVAQTWLQLVTTARIGDWIEQTGARPLRQRLLRNLDALLLHPVAPPTDAAAVVAPLQWLLRRAADGGLALTERGYLTRQVVREAVEVHGWQDETLGKPVSTEAHLLTLPRWHGLLREQRWVRRRGRKLVITEAGRALVSDVEAAWRALCAGLAAPEEQFDGAAREAVLLILLDAGDERVRNTDVMQGVADLVAEAGWRVEGNRPLDADVVRYAAGPFLGTLERFGLLEGRWDRRGPEGEHLTEAGRASALEMLRHRATAPREDLRG